MSFQRLISCKLLKKKLKAAEIPQVPSREQRSDPMPAAAFAGQKAKFEDQAKSGVT